MNKLKIILIDALILFAVSTVVVYSVNWAFSLIGGHGPKADPIVTAIIQDNAEELRKLVEVRTEPTAENAASDRQDGETRDSARNPADLTDGHGRTALMRAAFVNNSKAEITAKSDVKRAEMVPLLLDHGAPIDARDEDGWTALMWASWSGLPKTTRQLLDRGASVSPADKLGNTALMLAAGRANIEIVSQLLAAAADKTARNKAGKSASDIAREGTAQYPDKKDAYQKISHILEDGAKQGPAEKN